ncbi:MAG: hypothetical protein M1822_004069 [Bathelium mastoideum]|nr:MAG: hypothetical protein M1822_004069 [Bathelium mastoideum]
MPQKDVFRDRLVCGICGITEYSYKRVTRFFKDRKYSTECVPPGLVKIRHFDGTDYFWDIGHHLLLSDCKIREDPEKNSLGERDIVSLVESYHIQDQGAQLEKGKDSQEITNAPGPSALSSQKLEPQDDAQGMNLYPFYSALSLKYLSETVVPEPLHQWREGNRVATVFEKRDTSDGPDIRDNPNLACLNCGALKEHQAQWNKANRGLVLNFHRTGPDGWFWYFGSKAFLKETNYQTRVGTEEAAVNFVREHTTVPVPGWIREWHEGNRCVSLQDRLPGVDLEIAAWGAQYGIKDTLLNEKEVNAVFAEVGEYMKQLHALTSPRPETADGRLMRNFPFWMSVLKAHWFLPQSHEEAVEDWYQKSLTGITQEDLPKLDHLRETYPREERYVFIHGDLTYPNILVGPDKHVSGIIDWEYAGFAPDWWDHRNARLGIFSKENVSRDTINSAIEWCNSWTEIFEPGWERSLWAARDRRHPYNRDREIQETTDEVFRQQLLQEKEKRRQKVAKWNTKVLAPQLPPYPEIMHDMYPPNHYMDEEGIWIEFNEKPMYDLPEFDVSRCHLQ